MKYVASIVAGAALVAVFFLAAIALKLMTGGA